MAEHSVAVRALAEFCHRQGDLDHRFSPSPTGAEGTEGHQRCYKRRPSTYQPEYPVDLIVDSVAGSLQVRGRADGYDPQGALLEEIKTCRIDPAVIPEPITRLHLAQGRLYAALIARRENLAGLTVRLTWLHLDEDAEHSLDQYYDRDELDDFLEESLTVYARWLAAITIGRQVRDESVRTLEFPYPDFRKGQREIAELVYKCIDQSGQLMLEAPTGIGKTAAVLFPALKGLATGKHDRIIFTTAREVGRRTAEDTLQHFSTAGLCGNSLTLTAKDKICFSPGKACHAEDCRYALGYYDKLPAARVAAMEVKQLNREALEAVARAYDLCPYQLSLDLLDWVDLVIADLHYLYSMTAVLADLATSDPLRWTALVDEAHNLPGRAREMFRASLAKADLMQARREAPASLKRPLDRINRKLLSLQKTAWREPDFDSVETLPDGLLLVLQDFINAVGEALASDPIALQRAPGLLDFYFSVLQFLRVAEHWGPEYRFEKSRGQSAQSLRLTLNCLDPARLLRERQRELHATVGFSATLSPAHWLRASLGFEDASVCRQLKSPFSPDQLGVTVDTLIDTRFRQRAATLPELAARIGNWLGDQPGNCLVYFPSYRYLRDCLALMEGDGLLPGSRRVWVQEQDALPEQRESLLSLLHSERNMAAFCILGGIFGEGVDLPGEALSSVVVVGVGFPQVNRQSEQLRDYYQREYGRGFEFTYLYPGLQKVNQALGRVVRGTQDRGHALVIDSRYGLAEYRQLLAPWWRYTV